MENFTYFIIYKDKKYMYTCRLEHRKLQIQRRYQQNEGFQLVPAYIDFQDTLSPTNDNLTYILNLFLKFANI